MFNAAGLIVPEPSIMLAPIPFIDDDAGSGAEYIMARLGQPCWWPLSCGTDAAGAPEGRGREWRRGWLHSEVRIVDDEVWRGFVACREMVARKESLGPLFPGTISTLPFQPATPAKESKVEWRRTGR